MYILDRNLIDVLLIEPSSLTFYQEENERHSQSKVSNQSDDVADVRLVRSPDAHVGLHALRMRAPPKHLHRCLFLVSVRVVTSESIASAGLTGDGSALNRRSCQL